MIAQRVDHLRRRLAARLAPQRTGDTASGADVPARGSDDWWDLLPFTTHRIRFADGVESMHDGSDPFRDVRSHVVRGALPGGLAGRSVVDLGCAEGGFALAFAADGADRVLGIEAREISVRRAELARDLLGLEQAEFVVADIKQELAQRGEFDVVFATGILYHVADPASMLVAMRAACREVALIDTHVAHPDVVTHDCSEVVERTFAGTTYRGRLFTEYPPETTDADKEGMLWAAWNDAEVFWPFEDDLVEMIRAAGFDRIEWVDPHQAHADHGWGVDHRNRVMYLARP